MNTSEHSVPALQERTDRRTRHSIARIGFGLLAVALVVAGALAVHDNASSSWVSKAKAVATKPRPTAKPITVVALVRTPTDAAEQLYFAWQRGDHAGAARFANRQAARSLFSVPTTAAAGLAFFGCSKPAHGASTCSWVRSHAQLAMHVNVTRPGRPQVQTVAFHEEPKS